jgi:hypothetical protein
MKKHTRIAIIVVLALATTAHAAVVRPDAPDEQPEISWRLPVISAPLMAEAPTIDG